MSYSLHPYQQRAVDFALQRMSVQDEPGAGLFLDPGLGKTLITLEIFEQLRMLEGARKALIVAPLRVCYSVWPKEVAKWGFKFQVSLIHGTARKRAEALQLPADIYLINPEGIAWLLTSGLRIPKFDLLVLDESTKFKSWSSKRTKCLRKFAPLVPKRMILTGTPTPNTLLELFSQVYMLDAGKTLGSRITKFRERYAIPVGNVQYGRYEMREDLEDELRHRIAPLCLSMDAENNLDMPRLIANRIRVDLPLKVHRAYKQIEKQLFAELDNGKDLIANSAAAKYSLCRQVANGGAYQTDEVTGVREEIHVHNAKIDALADLYEELNGKQLLVAYQFNHDLARIKTRFPQCAVINGKTKPGDMPKTIAAWQRQELGMLAVQCQAMSHGVDGLQDGGADVCWLAPTDQPEIHKQLIGRLYRQGSTASAVRVHYLIANGTVDEVIHRRITTKDKKQADLLTMLREYRGEI